MEVVHGRDREFKASGHEHRPGKLEFIELLKGNDGAPENFGLLLSRQDGEAYFAPRHRHNFDQVRLAVDGDLSIGTKSVLRQGHIGYFPEGTPYGPQNDPPGRRQQLVLQFGGASGEGYMSQDDSLRGFKELRDAGRFDNGVFRTPEGSDRKNIDGYQAVWEHIRGRPLRYPRPRYDSPILINPEHFAWCQTGMSGVRRKLLGVFTERATRIEIVHIEPKATFAVSPERAIRLFYFMSGNALISELPCHARSAVKLAPDETGTFTGGAEAAELLVMVLPLLAETLRPVAAD